MVFAKKTKSGRYDRRHSTKKIVATWGIATLFKLLIKLLLTPFYYFKYVFFYPIKIVLKLIMFPINYYNNRNK